MTKRKTKKKAQLSFKKLSYLDGIKLRAKRQKRGDRPILWLHRLDGDAIVPTKMRNGTFDLQSIYHYRRIWPKDTVDIGLDLGFYFNSKLFRCEISAHPDVEKFFLPPVLISPNKLTLESLLFDNIFLKLINPTVDNDIYLVRGETIASLICKEEIKKKIKIKKFK